MSLRLGLNIPLSYKEERKKKTFRLDLVSSLLNNLIILNKMEGKQARELQTKAQAGNLLQMFLLLFLNTLKRCV